jgi:NAD(P)H-dependent FMN reductase
MPTSPLQICLIGGSAEHPSRILACLQFLAELLQVSGAVTHIWDLAQRPLPLLDPCCYPTYRNGPVSVKDLAVLADDADAFIWGSPVYHNSFSGVLKNALDNLAIQHFCHKPVALVSCGNSDRSGSQPCDHLRSVARGLHAVTIPTQLITLPSDFARIQGVDDYFLTNEALQDRATRLAEELLLYASALRFVRGGIEEKLLSQVNSHAISAHPS